MAAATSVWAKPGAWALESEEHADMEKLKFSSVFPSLVTVASDEPSADFPSLSAAAAASKSSKKKKPQVLSLAEFSGGKPVSHGAGSRYRPADAFSSKGLATEEILSLPTGPRERTAEELERSSRGFGYSSYGNGGSRRMDGSASRDSGDEIRRNSLNKDSGPSRADEVDDWSSMKRSAGPPERRERGGGSFDSQSRADEVDSWISKRSMVAPSNGDSRVSDGMRERGVGFGSRDSETWERRRDEVNRSDSDTWGKKRDDVPRADPISWGRKKEEVIGAGGGRPRLVLQPRSVPLANGNTDSIADVNQGENYVPAINSKGSNPFGLARPREEVLAEKGEDWKKLDEKLESTKTREGVPDVQAFGRRGLALANKSFSDDRTEKSWRKEHTSTSTSSIKKDETLEVTPDT